MNVKSISLKQPWAQCIFSAGKNVENRVWNTTYRGWIAIHASNTRAPAEFLRCAEKYGRRFDPDSTPRGAVLGFARLSEVIRESDVTKPNRKWFEGEYGFVLTDIIPLKSPVVAKGALGLRDLDPVVLRACLREVGVADRKRLEKARD